MLDFNKKDYKKFLYYILILAILIPVFIFILDKFNVKNIDKIAFKIVDIYVLLIITYSIISGIIRRNVFSEKNNNYLCMFWLILGIVASIAYIFIGKIIINIYLVLVVLMAIYLYIKSKKVDE
ncbi:hypothetical protein [Peptacetobacter sp. AB800]|uniref:hypothetical protein n=1 Tax=Peptacetobacter sp. AB800 TaxID=3388428 RepID=UPI0039FCF19E